MLLKKVPLLTDQINALEQINATYVKQDSLKNEEITLYKNAYEEQNAQYSKLKKNFKKYKTYSIIGGVVAFILGFLVCR